METEREANLLSLPLYLHNLIQLPLIQGRDYVLAETKNGASFADILQEPPTSTLTLLKAPEFSIPPAPTLPPREGTLLEESLGAYVTQLLCERLSDYLVAESLGATWRGDRYQYFETTTGEHLFWISQWQTTEATQKMAALLRTETASSYPTHDRIRFREVITDGTTLRFANCADQATLDELLSPQSHSTE